MCKINNKMASQFYLLDTNFLFQNQAFFLFTLFFGIILNVLENKHEHVRIILIVVKSKHEQVINCTSFGCVEIQSNFDGSNTDGSFTTAVSNSFLSPLEKKARSCRFGIIYGVFLIHIKNGILCALIRIASMRRF